MLSAKRQYLELRLLNFIICYITGSDWPGPLTGPLACRFIILLYFCFRSHNNLRNTNAKGIKKYFYYFEIVVNNISNILAGNILLCRYNNMV